jgi:hypothetical protein
LLSKKIVKRANISLCAEAADASAHVKIEITAKATKPFLMHAYLFSEHL